MLFWTLVVSFAWYNGTLMFHGETPSTDSYFYGFAFALGTYVALVLAGLAGASRRLLQASVGAGGFCMLVLTVLSVTNRIAFAGPILLTLFSAYSVIVLLGALLARGVRSLRNRFNQV